MASLQEAGEAPPMLSVQDVPETFAIESIYPNPFNPSTTVRVGLVERGMYHVGVYNTLGQQVYQSELDASAPGWYTVRLTLDTFSSGVYFVHVRHRTTGAVVTGKMLLVK